MTVLARVHSCSLVSCVLVSRGPVKAGERALIHLSKTPDYSPMEPLGGWSSVGLSTSSAAHTDVPAPKGVFPQMFGRNGPRAMESDDRSHGEVNRA